MKIEKKAWPEMFEDVKNGKKNFDVRLADFNCKPNDVLVFREWNPETKEYTGRIIEKKICYILRTKDAKFWKKEDVKKYGFQVIGLK